MVENKKEVKKTVKKTEDKKPVTKVVRKKTKVTNTPVNKETRKKNLSIRGNIFEGIVITAKADKTITVQRQLTHYISKYERYKKVYSKIKAHVPEGMEVKEGDKVKIGETRKISKTKNFVLMEVLGEKK